MGHEQVRLIRQPIELLIEGEILKATEQGTMLQLDEFDFYYPDSKTPTRRIFQLGSNRLLIASSTSYPTLSHDVTLTGPDLDPTSLYSVAYPYKDTTERDTLIQELQIEEIKAYDDAHIERNVKLDMIPSTQSNFHERADAINDEYVRQVNDVLPERYDSQRLKLEKIPGVPRAGISFAPTIENERGKSATFGIKTQEKMGPFWIPIKGWDVNHLNDQDFRRVVLNSLTPGKANVLTWVDYFKRVQDHLQDSPRLSLYSKLLTLGATPEQLQL